MPRAPAITTEALHDLMWERSDRLGRLKVMQMELADEIGCTKFTMCRIFAKMESEGRIRKLQGHKGNTWTYAVKDPEQWS